MNSQNVDSNTWLAVPYDFSHKPSADTFFLMALIREGRWREDQYQALTTNGDLFWATVHYKLPHGLRCGFRSSVYDYVQGCQEVSLPIDGIQKLPITIHLRWVGKDHNYEVIINDRDLDGYSYDESNLLVTVILAKIATYLYSRDMT